MDLSTWEIIFKNKVSEIAKSDDLAHDILHFKRVVQMAKQLCVSEGANFNIVVPAAWLHDFVIIPKNSPQRSQASKLSAVAAIEFLNSIQYPQEFHTDIAHAIEGHSFSANIPVLTLEAMIVQDADRLDAIGAIGIARCFATAGILKTPFYSDDDPFCDVRNADDSKFTIDHFYKKLLKIADNLKTKSGQIAGQKRIEFMKSYLAVLKTEI